MSDNEVVIIKDHEAFYPEKSAAFTPDTDYPEYPFKDKIKYLDFDKNKNKNPVYNMVREAFYLAGYDKEHYGTELWNPLGKFINSGDTVLIKPNMVLEKNQGGFGEDCLYTQPSVIAPVIDYVLIALSFSHGGGGGHVIIGDAPVQGCDFEKFINSSGYKDLIDFYKSLSGSVKIELKDLRQYKSYLKNGVRRHEGAEKSGIDVNLNADSLFNDENLNHKNFRVTCYDPHILNSYHNKNRHVYNLSADALSADVIINMPKPKSHRKAGLTISMKNLIGIIARKECVPHHTNGSPVNGGDEYQYPSFWGCLEDKMLDWINYLSQTAEKYKTAKIIRFCMMFTGKLRKLFNGSNKYREGSWRGNNTICKSIVDINRCYLYSDKGGKLQDKKQRKYLIIADMIVSGEHNGPLSPEPKHNGIIAVGENLVAFDAVMSKLMGIKPEYFRTLEYAKRTSKYDISPDNKNNKNNAPLIISNYIKYNNKTPDELSEKDLLYFIPPDGWEEGFLSKTL